MIIILLLFVKKSAKLFQYFGGFALRNLHLIWNLCPGLLLEKTDYSNLLHVKFLLY